MKIKARVRLVSVIAAAAVVMSGCQTTGGVSEEAAGAGIGALVGCGIGAAITGTARGCAGGAAIGGLLGFGVVKLSQYEARQVRSAKADQRLYGLTQSTDSTQVKIRKGKSTPKTVKAGDSVKIVTDYSLVLPRGETSTTVKESWALKKDGKVVMNMEPQRNSRESGGWAANAEIPIPSSAAAGTYVVVHRVEAGKSYDETESTFVVRS